MIGFSNFYLLQKSATPVPVVTDSQLQQVAKEACGQDWALFANKLGFTLDEVKEVANKLPDKPEDQVRSRVLKTPDKIFQELNFLVLL